MYFDLKGVEDLRGVVGTRKVELQAEGVVKHAFNLANMENWLAEGKLLSRQNLSTVEPLYSGHSNNLTSRKRCLLNLVS